MSRSDGGGSPHDYLLGGERAAGREVEREEADRVPPRRVRLRQRAGRVEHRVAQRLHARAHGVELEKILLTHGHIDHCGGAGILAEELGVPIEGPEEQDRFWIARLEEDGRAYGIPARTFEPDRWLADGETVTVGELSFDVRYVQGLCNVCVGSLKNRNLQFGISYMYYFGQ